MQMQNMSMRAHSISVFPASTLRPSVLYQIHSSTRYRQHNNYPRNQYRIIRSSSPFARAFCSATTFVETKFDRKHVNKYVPSKGTTSSITFKSITSHKPSATGTASTSKPYKHAPFHPRDSSKRIRFSSQDTDAHIEKTSQRRFFNPRETSLILNRHGSTGSIPKIVTKFVPIPGGFKVLPNGPLKTTFYQPKDKPVLLPPQLNPALQQVFSHTGPVFAKSLNAPDFEQIPSYKNIIPHMLPTFITSSRDFELLSIAARLNASYAASSSSTTGFLSKLHMALYRHAPLCTSNFSKEYSSFPRNFTPTVRAPHLATLTRRGLTDNGIDYRGSFTELLAAYESGETPVSIALEYDPSSPIVWGIDSLAPFYEPNGPAVLMDLGHILERKFTSPIDEFNSLIENQQNVAMEESCHLFSNMEGMVVRGQLDCHNPDFKKNPVIDIKTRAVRPIRYNIAEYERLLDYSIDQVYGTDKSFEIEWYDMARSAFLKYSLQCRIGQMNGIFVAYHNTATIFGYEFISVEKMDRIICGSSKVADLAYSLSMRLMRKILDAVVKSATKISEESAGTADVIRLAVATSQFRAGEVFIYAETVPPPYLDHDVGAPFPQRLNSLSRCETLTTNSLLEIVQRFGLPKAVERTDPVEQRVEILNILKQFFIENRSQSRPSVNYYSKLVKLGYLRKYHLKLMNGLFTSDDLYEAYENGESATVGLPMEMLQHAYQLVEVPVSTAQEHYHVAMEYYQAMGINKGENFSEVKKDDIETSVEDRTDEIAEQVEVVEKVVS